MRRAAQGLRDASRTGSRSRQLAQRLAEAQPSESPVLDPNGVGTAVEINADALAAELSAAARSGRRWGELPGHLRTEILQMSQGRYRDDYARLIQLYFREIAADGEPATPSGEAKP
jgi:hypothetical protein